VAERLRSFLLTSERRDTVYYVVEDVKGLHPCPLCGGKATLMQEHLDERFGYAIREKICCDICALSIVRTGDQSKGGYADNSKVRDNLVSAWNNRCNLK